MTEYHDVPWECPLHGEKQLHGGGGKLYCGLCEFHDIGIQIAEDKAYERCAQIAEAIDSGRGNEAEIARAIRDRKNG